MRDKSYMIYCFLIILSACDKACNTQNADNSSRSNTKYHDLPLAFVRSDAVRLVEGSVRYAGYYGCGWSRTASSSTGAYYLAMNPTNVNPSDSTVRYYGFPLRCLYPGSA